MSASDVEISQATLLAYADGKLDLGQRAMVAHHLAANADAAALVSQYILQNEAIAALFPSTDHEVLPQRLKPGVIRAALQDQAKYWGRLAAAAIVLLALGSALGWNGRDFMRPNEAASDRLIASALTAHSLYVKESLHAVEVAADVPHLMTWLSNRLNTEVAAPDLSSQGFAFIGGRLLPPGYDQDRSRPAAQLMYENQTNDRVTVYLTGGLGAWDGKAFQRAHQDGLEAFYWAYTDITCTVVGDLPDAEMQLVAKKVYQQLTWRPDPGGSI